MPNSNHPYISTLVGCVLVSLFATACQDKLKAANPSRTAPQQSEAPGFIAKNDAPVFAAALPITFSAGDEVPAAMTAACARAAKTLNESVSRDLIQVKSDTDGPFRLHWIADQASEPSHQASTELTVNDQNHIVGAEIRFDTSHFVFSESPDESQVDNESVCLHELGHSLGLAHSNDPASFMYKTLSNGIKRRGLSDEDRRNLQRVY